MDHTALNDLSREQLIELELVLLCAVIGQLGVTEVPRFRTNAEGVAHRAELDTWVTAFAGERTVEDVAAILKAHAVAHGKLLSAAEIVGGPAHPDTRQHRPPIKPGAWPNADDAGGAADDEQDARRGFPRPSQRNRQPRGRPIPAKPLRRRVRGPGVSRRDLRQERAGERVLLR